MKIIIPPLQVTEEDGFANDLFERHHFGEALTNLVSNSQDQGLVISLDGAWGEGKTTFIKMWRGMLKKSGIPSIYIDAFASDYAGDPFLSVAGAITAYIEENIKSDKISDLKTKAKKVGARLLPFSAKLLTKVVTLGAINHTDIQDLELISKDIAKDTSVWIEDLIEEKLKNHSEDIELIESFKSVLSKISKQLSEDKPLVIIIDELDRCKPTFAVDLIERTKHLFLVDNIIFVLSINKQQLEESVKCVYGQNIDASSYLQKFINIETYFPKRMESNQGTGDIQKYAENLLELHGFESFYQKVIMLESMKILCQHFVPSLRQLEKIYTAFTVFFLSENTDFKQYITLREVDSFIPLSILLTFVKVLEPELFRKILSKQISNDKLGEELKLNALFEIEHSGTEIMSNNLRSIFSCKALKNDSRSIRIGKIQVRQEDIIFHFANKVNLFNII